MLRFAEPELMSRPRRGMMIKKAARAMMMAVAGLLVTYMAGSSPCR